MGPPLQRGGRRRVPPHRGHARRASMGPPLQRGGREPRSSPSCSAPGGFNGATASTRWKVARPGPHLLDDGVVLQWGHRFNAVEGIDQSNVYRDFQGASMGPPLQRGGREGGVWVPRTVWRASMGPPLQRGGRFSESGHTRLTPTASMGPPLQRGGRPNHCGHRLRSARLQWGHRFNAVEGAVIAAALYNLTRLQWGHRFNAVEGRVAGWYASATPDTLQWGHRFNAVEGTHWRH